MPSSTPEPPGTGGGRPHRTLLTNGLIHPRADSPRCVSGMLIEAGRVAWIGDAEPDAAAGRSRTSVVDLQGRTVLPGLIDAHLHLEQYARSLAQVDCGQATLRACLDRIRSHAEQVPSGGWIVGHGWDQNRWGGFPNAADLDRAVGGRPAYLTARSLHAAWTNSAGLQAAGIDSSTLDPPDGSIQRHPDGSPTGILLEGAMRLVSERIVGETVEQRAAQIGYAQARLLSLGITGVHDFDGPSCFETIQWLRQANALQLRIVKNLPASLADQLLAVGLRTGFGDEWIRLGHLKVFADGALGPRTAAMLQPYLGEPANRGMLLIDQESLAELAIRATRSGLATSVHAIGDQANHEVLAAFRSVRDYEEAHHLPRLRHRVEHLQLVHPDDSSRTGELGLVASMQPIHATSDLEMAERFWGDRLSGAYAWRTQIEAGARLAFGSDAPVEDPNPFLGLYAALTRRRLDGYPGPAGWLPQQRISLPQALAAYTTGPAYAAWLEGVQGRLEPGYLADLIVLPRDPYDCRPEELAGLQPAATMVAGEWRYRGF